MPRLSNVFSRRLSGTEWIQLGDSLSDLLTLSFGPRTLDNRHPSSSQ